MFARSLLPLVALLALAPASLRAQEARPPANPEKGGTYLGVLFSAVPEAVYSQLPALARNQGVLVTHVLPDSPAAKADLRRHDILLAYDSHKVRDPEHLARLIRDDREDRTVRLLVLRNGRETTIDVKLGLGPVLRIAPEARPAAAADAAVPHGVGKAGGPPSVSVSATPLGDGGLRLTIEFYPDGASRPKVVTCSGSPAEIDREIQKLPSNVQGLTRIALDRIRARELQKGVQPNPSPSSKSRQR